MDSLNVLFVCQSYPPQAGGLARAGQRISSHLEPHCSSLKRLVLDASLAPAQAVEQAGLIRLGPMPEEEETLQLVEQLVAHLEPLDLVHAFYAGPLAAAAVAGALRAGKPSLVSLRGNDLDRGFYRAKGASLLSWLVGHATALSCVSREQVNKLRLWFDRPDGVFIANSVDGDLFYPDQPLEDLGEGPIVLFSGEMRWKKGLPLVLELADQFQIVLAGGVRGPEKRLLRQQAPKVKILDYQHDDAWLRRLYCRADVVWLPAFWEGMPNALLEAMACGRPVLANRVGGVADLISAENGWTLGLNESHLHAERIQEILDHPGPRGARARQYVLENHRPAQETRAYLDLYSRCNASWKR